MRAALLFACFGLLCGPVASAGDPLSKSPLTPQQSSVDLSYIDSGFVAGFVVHPRQAMQSAFGKMLIENAFEGSEFKEVTAEFSKRFGVEVEDVSQLAVLFNEKSLATSMGMRLPEGGPGGNALQLAQTNQLKQIALAFHNYHSVHNHFPPANGKVSWRVHLLPYLEHADLYQQFDLGEDWDSDTNKPLIAQMPDVFKTVGVAAGKTSIQVFAGKGGPFENDELSIRDIIDGTSLTIMAAIAGSDKATEWTKPGGLDVEEDVWKSFGDSDDSVLVALMDGSVQSLSKDLNAETLSGLITHQGRELLDYEMFRGDGVRQAGPDPSGNPTVIARCVSRIDQDKAIATFAEGFGKPTQKRGNGKAYWDVGGYAIWFPDDNTLVATQTELLPRVMSNRRDDSKLRRFIREHGNADVLLMADSEAMPRLFAQVMENAPVPNMKEITDAWLAVDVTSASVPLLNLNVGMSNPTSATGMSAMMNASLAMGQQSVTQATPPGMESFAETLTGLMKGRKVELNDKTLSYSIPKPANYDAAVARMKPEFKKVGESVRAARKAARSTVKRNVMKEIGLAFHNYHDVYGTFGTADGSSKNARRKAGLSWRVHILPFIEEIRLYEQFKLDEPWDSEHNKKLIAKMPPLYKVEGVADEGKTSIHVFVGDNGIFGDGKTPAKIRDITDGTSNTILAVMAGPDKAEIWTKPGGLKFDRDKSTVEMLGNIGEFFIALFGDGSVRTISKDVDDGDLRAFITQNGGEVVR